MTTSAKRNLDLFEAGALVMLHPDGKIGGKPHPDAGRIGRIVSREGERMVVEFWQGPHRSTFCLIPLPHWAPVPEFCAETYERDGMRGWRLHDRGARIFAGMGWRTTAATGGAA